MITTKIKTLFQFIEFLHSNIANFNLNNNLIKELELLDKERQKVTHKKTFKDKLKYDEVQAEIEKKFKILQDNTANLIKAKAKELNVCNFDNEPNYSFNGIQTEIHHLKENFSKKDLPEIFKHKEQYIEYRSQTHKTFLSLAFFINELDEITKSLFDYFKDTEQNEFEAFETKTIQVNDLREAVELFSIGKKKFSVPLNSKQTRNIPMFNTHEKLFEALIFSANEEHNKPIAGAYELLKEVWFFINSDSATFNGKYAEKYKRPLFVNPVIIGKPEFDKFFESKITYCSTQNKIGLKEQDFITDISNWIEKKSKDESVSIPRNRKFNEFLEYIKSKSVHHQPKTKEYLSENTESELNEYLSQQITHSKKVEISNAIREKYLSYKGKDFKILYEALLKLDLFPSKGKRSLFFRCLQNEGYNINSVQMLEKKYFKTGYVKIKGGYEKSEDEIQRDKIIEYLKTIIETK